jgi:hypothetical protein
MKTIKTTYYLLAFVFLAWGLFSYLDIITHNLTPGYEYSNINLIYLLVKGI